MNGSGGTGGVEDSDGKRVVVGSGGRVQMDSGSSGT